MTQTLTITEFLKQEQQEIGEIGNFVSPTRMSLFFRCPLAFRKRYIEGITSPPTPALSVGKVAHNVLATVYRLRSVGQNCTVEDLPTFVADAWKWCMEREPCDFANDAEEAKYREQTLGLLTAYFAATPIQEEMPSVIEKRLEVPLVDPLTGENFGIPLVGVVDLVLREQGDNDVIVDFKTAASSSHCELQHEIQLTAYAYLHREVSGQDESGVELRTLVKTKTPKILTHRFQARTDAHFKRFFGLVREYLDTLDRGVFNYRPGWACSMCEHSNNGTCC